MSLVISLACSHEYEWHCFPLHRLQFSFGAELKQSPQLDESSEFKLLHCDLQSFLAQLRITRLTQSIKYYEKFIPVRVDGEKMATILCGSSHQEGEFISTALELELGHVTCFGQWFISTYDACRGLVSACALGLPSSAAGNPETTTWRSLGQPPGWWEHGLRRYHCSERGPKEPPADHRDQPSWPRLKLLSWPIESWINENNCCFLGY